MNNLNMDIFESLAGSVTLWALIMLGLAVSALLIRSGYMMLGYVNLFQKSSIETHDMVAGTTKIGILIAAGLVFYYFVS